MAWLGACIFVFVFCFPGGREVLVYMNGFDHSLFLTNFSFGILGTKWELNYNKFVKMQMGEVNV